LSGVTCSGASASRLKQAVARATEDVPYLAADTAEMLMSLSDAEILEPDEIFRRSQKLAATGLAGLDAGEIREFRAINDSMYASLPYRDRARISAYIDKLRRGEFPTTEEDAGARVLVKSATLRLSPEKKSSLQQLYRKAILTSVARPAQ
jgi:hypothetical protein